MSGDEANVLTQYLCHSMSSSCVSRLLLKYDTCAVPMRQGSDILFRWYHDAVCLCQRAYNGAQAVSVPKTCRALTTFVLMKN